MLKGGVFRYTSFFYEKNFHSKTLDFTRFYKIIEKKLKNNSKKLLTFKKVVYICKVNKAQQKNKIMKRFSKSKTYLDKDGNKYSYEGKYRGFYQFYKFLGTHTPLNTYSERELLKLDLTEK